MKPSDEAGQPDASPEPKADAGMPPGAPDSAPEPPPARPETEGMTPAELQARQLQTEADVIKARAMRMDETVPGGKYVVNGEFVNAEGKPVK